MGLQQQRQQPDNVQDHTHAHKAVPWMRWLIAVVILLLIVVGIIIWILIDQSSWTTILPVVIFTVLGVVIALFQWLFPVSTGAHTHEHTANSFPASLMPQLSTVSPAVATMPQIIVHVPPADHMSLPQSGPLDKAPYRGIMGVPPPTDPRTIQQREKAVRDVYTKLTQSDISAIALTGIGGVGKSTLAALIYRYAEVQRRAGNGPFTAEAIWLNVDPAATMADLAGNLFELFGKPLPDFGNLSLQHQAMALFNVIDTTDRPRIIVLDQFENLLDWQTGHALPDRPGVGEWLDAINSQPCTCRILLTSRPWPQGTREYPPTCMQEYFVQGLETSEGIELLRKLRIEASETDLRTVVERCQGHAFALTLLASLLRNRNLGLAAFFKDPIYAQIWSGNVARNLLDYIYRQQLNEEQRELLLAFSVYREPVPLAAAQALVDLSSEVSKVQVQSALDALLAQHLLQASGDGRYQLHALVANYAQSHFDESNEPANKEALRAARARAAQYYLQQASTSCPPPDKRRQISDVQPLIEAIWQFCQSGQWQSAFDLMEQEKLFMSLKNWGCNADLLELYQLLLPSDKWQPGPLHTAFIYNDLGVVYRMLWRMDRAREYLERALSICREIGERRMAAWALNNLGRVYADSGNKEYARECYQEALEIFREEKERNGEGAALNNLGWVYSAWGMREQEKDYFKQALGIFREVGDLKGEAAALNSLGQAYEELGKTDEALKNYEQALSVFRGLGARRGEGWTLNNIGKTYITLGQLDQAQKHLEQALAIRRVIDHKGEGRTLNNLGMAYAGLGNKEQAWGCYWQALEITEEIGDQEGNSRVLRNISMIYLDEHRHDLALAALLLAKDVLNEMQNPDRNKMQRDIDKLRNEIGDEQFEVLLTRIEPQAQQLMEQARQ